MYTCLWLYVRGCAVDRSPRCWLYVEPEPIRSCLYTRLIWKNSHRASEHLALSEPVQFLLDPTASLNSSSHWFASTSQGTRCQHQSAQPVKHLFFGFFFFCCLRSIRYSESALPRLFAISPIHWISNESALPPSVLRSIRYSSRADSHTEVPRSKIVPSWLVRICTILRSIPFMSYPLLHQPRTSKHFSFCVFFPSPSLSHNPASNLQAP